MKDKVKALFQSTKFLAALAALIVISLNELGLANLDQETVTNALKLGLVVVVGHSATQVLSDVNKKIEENKTTEEKVEVKWFNI